MDQLLTLEEAAKLCRYESKESFRKAVHRRGLPAIKIDRELLFDANDLINYLKEHHNIHAKGKKGAKQEDRKCHLNKGPASGTSVSPRQTASAYDSLLGLATS